MAKIALLFWTTDLAHAGDLVITICGLRPQKGDGQDTQMAKIGRPKKKGDLSQGHRLFPVYLENPEKRAHEAI